MFLSRPIFDRNKARFISAVVTASDHARGTRNSMAHIANFLGATCAAPCCFYLRFAKKAAVAATPVGLRLAVSFGTYLNPCVVAKLLRVMSRSSRS
jgi:hypothetical protein